MLVCGDIDLLHARVERSDNALAAVAIVACLRHGLQGRDAN